MKLEDMVDMFIREACAGKINETPKAYRSKLRNLEKYLGSDFDSEQIDQAQVNRFKHHLLERDTIYRGGKEIPGRLSKFTIRTVLQTIRHFLKWGHKKGILPALELINIQEPDPEPKPIRQETFERLLLIAERHGEPWEQARNIAILYMLRDTGSRVGSIANLDVESLDFDQGFALVKDKGDKTSTLWISDQTIEAIREWLRFRYQLDPVDYRLFIGEKGAGLKRIGIYRVLQRLAKTGGIKDRHNPHSFRHAFARDSLLAGADLGQVSDLLNHRGILVTHKYYARWSKGELKKFHRRYGPGRFLPKPKKR